MRAVADLGGWAWYEFGGFLRTSNKRALHIASTLFDEPTLLGLLPRTNFVLAVYGADGTQERVVYVGGRWDAGRAVVTESINAATGKQGIHALDAPAHLRGTEPRNLTNRGKFGYGIQLEFSRGARNHLFPPDCSSGSQRPQKRSAGASDPHRPQGPC